MPTTGFLSKREAVGYECGISLAENFEGLAPCPKFVAFLASSSECSPNRVFSIIALTSMLIIKTRRLFFQH